MKRAILLIIAVIFFIIMVSLRQAGADWFFTDKEIDRMNWGPRPYVSPRPEKPEPKCYEKVFRLRFGSWVEATAVKRRFVYTLEADEKVLGITDNYLWLIRTLCEEAK